MLTPREALSKVLEHVPGPRQRESVTLEAAAGRFLARDVASDLDLPPFEKSAMDGYAVHAADFAEDAAPEAAQAGRSLPILGESRAGTPFPDPVPRGSCVAIYTGAEVPRGCDAVVMVELTERRGDRVLVRDVPRPGQHVCPRGQDLRSGEVVLGAGTRVEARHLSLLAAVGAQPLEVWVRPRVAVLTTGDELLEPHQRPGPGQIREGNTIQLTALARAAGADARNLGIVRDDARELERAFGAALEESDALITTGGVSMGEYDLVGAALERLDVRPVFHKVAIKPGKPLWFGLWRERVPVFALPGNPVSCLVGHEVFVRPALARMGGGSPEELHPPARRAHWNAPPTAPNPREQWVPARLLQGRDGSLLVEPVPWNGSGDVAGISRARALAVIPAGREVARGELVEVRDL